MKADKSNHPLRMHEFSQTVVVHVFGELIKFLSEEVPSALLDQRLGDFLVLRRWDLAQVLNDPRGSLVFS